MSKGRNRKKGKKVKRRVKRKKNKRKKRKERKKGKKWVVKNGEGKKKGEKCRDRNSTCSKVKPIQFSEALVILIEAQHLGKVL